MAKKKASNPAGSLKTDNGGRPVVDDGGRLVFVGTTEQLDPKGTPPVEPQRTADEVED